MSTVITHKTFPNDKKYEMELAGRPFSIEVGKYAELANAAAMVSTARPPSWWPSPPPPVPATAWISSP